MSLCPVTLREARAFVGSYHRHHKPPQGGLFAVAVESDDLPPRIIGVAIIGRPVAAARQDGYTAEVTRVCVLGGFPNACSMLYGASWRAARSLGYRRVGTYIRKDEPGTSLRAAGWRLIAETSARSWQKSNPSRPRVDKTEVVQRQLWEATA
jgi:hypothetical protein